MNNVLMDDKIMFLIFLKWSFLAFSSLNTSIVFTWKPEMRVRECIVQYTALKYQYLQYWDDSPS